MEEAQRAAGALSSEALEYGASLVVPGAPLGETLDAVERFILEKGGDIAFPPQISMNEYAAHDTAAVDEERTLAGVVKLDVGAAIDGYIGDNALTIDLTGEHADLLAACRAALDAGLKAAKPNGPISEMSAAIESAIRSAGFEPVANLSGHGLGRFEVHTEPSVPSVSVGKSGTLEPGMTVAIEPFATTGYGRIADHGDPEVFRQAARRNVRDPIARRVLQVIGTRRGMPFSARWLAREVGEARAKHAINALILARILISYAPLKEVQDGLVAQFERTIHVHEDTIEILTPWVWPKE